MPTLTEIRGTYPFVSTIPPDAEFTTLSQRLDGTFLVDVKFNLWKDAGFHRYSVLKYGAQKYGPDDFTFNAALIAAHYSRDGGNTWLVPTPQTYDRRHSAVSPMVINATKREFDFVWNAFRDLPADFDGEVLFRLELSASPTVIITSLPVSVTTDAAPSVATEIPKRSFKIDDFLGEGPIAPWRRGPSDFVTARSIPLLASAVRQILSTKAATNKWGGELAWDPSFGALFWTLPHAPGDEITEEQAAGYAELAMRIEPRILISSSEIRFAEINGGLAMFIRVRYKVAGSNNPDNMVFQSALNEVTIEV